MAVDSQRSHLGFSGLNPMTQYSNGPHFTDPFAGSASSNPSSHMFSHSAMGPSSEAVAKQQAARGNNVSMPYASVPITAPSLSAGTSLPPMMYGQQQDMLASQELLNPRSSYEQSFTTAPPSASHAFAPTAGPYGSMGYTTTQSSGAYTFPPQQADAQDQRRLSQPSMANSGFVDSSLDHSRQRQASLIDFSGRLPQQSREAFGDALDAGRGMVAMSQDATPRNIYGRGRESNDYGFPSTHSPHSSISSSSYNYLDSTNSSVTDYSSAAESLDLPSRTLPRPSGLLQGSMPPAPQSMMGQFSSKVSSNTQKKHKCKICDKRFTRPSSLQTHMYSHTGEKPFSCEYDGCGRHFSVVSNLRRHRKVHKGEGDHPSPDDC
ncbi:MAG: hypothetical protein M1824_002958 [Vezdaea acicularis]|nr:MAG: hypothetical protein M1824_002958 [Vezdaea acicularis]